jgi:hypothetical protein
MTCKLGVAIPDGAIEEMKARVVVTDEDLKIAAAEGMPLAICFYAKQLFLLLRIKANCEPSIERIRRHDVMARM